MKASQADDIRTSLLLLGSLENSMGKQETSLALPEIVIKTRHARSRAIAEVLADGLVWAGNQASQLAAAARRYGSGGGSRPNEVTRFATPVGFIQDVGR